MVISIKEESEVPIYMQIRDQIVIGISSGQLKAGDQLPTVRALAAEIGINTMTVSKSYQLLKQEGYISSDRRSGARVRSDFTKVKGLSEESRGQLRKVAAEACVGGMSQSEFLELCAKYYEGEKL